MSYPPEIVANEAPVTVLESHWTDGLRSAYGRFLFPKEWEGYGEFPAVLSVSVRGMRHGGTVTLTIVTIHRGKTDEDNDYGCRWTDITLSSWEDGVNAVNLLTAEWAATYPIVERDASYEPYFP